MMRQHWRSRATSDIYKQIVYEIYNEMLSGITYVKHINHFEIILSSSSSPKTVNNENVSD